MRILTALVRNAFKKVFLGNLGDCSSLNNYYQLSKLVAGRNMHVAAVNWVIADEYGRPKKSRVDPKEERKILMEDYEYDSLHKVPNSNKLLPSLIRKTAKQKLRMYVAQYIGFMVELNRNHKLDKAMNILDKFNQGKMKTKSNSVMYNVMISAYGKHGAPNTAFKLYNQMKKRGLQPTDRTFTSLFSACACASTPSAHLKRVYNLQNEMESTEDVSNAITYNALIQALVECEAEPEEPFEAYNTMLDKKFAADTYTYCYLLKACSRDKVKGITRALQLWEEMHQKNVDYNIYSYNMMLLVLRDCDLPPEQDGIESKIDILGGLETFLEKLSELKIKPNITTFDLLSYIVPYQQIGDLIKYTRANKITLDVAFMNSLLRRQVLEGKLSHAKTLFKILLTTGVEPDLKTYQVLASCCQSKDQGLKMLKDMKVAGLNPNSFIYGTLLKTAVNNYDFKLVVGVMEYMLEDGAYPNEIIMDILQTALRKSGKASSTKVTKWFPKFYTSWQKRIKANRVEIDDKVENAV
ncbi:Pentatricopeptide repeat-containing protein 1, mitochondrial [Trichoplax sp. H2]|nr:Pentatricopeptide repeat-containing protein 1, mitochondrial [Trichoplax sp. H2]|eukprot:RDD45657.1 Pentatricopeptide repeat-containing protein 1, mitochondrial [Trichoplax sp. H2]